VGGVAAGAGRTAIATASAAAVDRNRMREVMLMCRKPFDKGDATLE